MSEVALMLSKEWVFGFSILSSACVIAYVVSSVVMVISNRKNGYDVGVCGMIPIVNIIITIKNIVKTSKENSVLDTEVELEL